MKNKCINVDNLQISDLEALFVSVLLQLPILIAREILGGEWLGSF